MSPGSRPKRNGSFPPTSSTAPAAANTKPRTRSSLPISRIGSIASDNSNHYWVLRQTRKQHQPTPNGTVPWTRQNARARPHPDHAQQLHGGEQVEEIIRIAPRIEQLGDGGRLKQLLPVMLRWPRQREAPFSHAR